MRAAFLGGVLDVQAEGMPVPEIEQPDDVLIEVSHAGVLLTLHPMDGSRSVLAPAIVPVQTCAGWLAHPIWQSGQSAVWKHAEDRQGYTEESGPCLGCVVPP